MKQLDLRLLSAGLVTLLLAGCSGASSTESPQKTESETSAVSNEETSSTEEDFRKLKLADFIVFEGDETTWAEVDGVLRTTGTPRGYVHSKESFGNFTLRCDYLLEPSEARKNNPEKSNTGFMLVIQEPHKIWPRSLEVQGRWEMMGGINPNGKLPAPVIQDHPDVREKVRKPVGEWNTVEITMKDGAITSRLNGEIVSTSEAAEETAGQIGLQAEGDAVQFRNVRIRVDGGM
ncbi:MAG TPA: DUF1080 domain-containing protein [Planctomicrobium sp.]|nr:DUF1080 domain-containing protein [Planctomicrobium sp.]